MAPRMSIVKAARLLAVGVAVVIATGNVYAQHGHGDAQQTLRITGEVMDLVCFMQHPDSGQGPDHSGCARQCIMKGLPAGLKTDKGMLYLLLPSGHGDIREQVAKFAGQVTTVEGHVIESGGLKALVVKHLNVGGEGQTGGSHAGSDHSGHDH